MSLRVLIAGAGLGGLTLAHGLRNANLDVAVFESDHPRAGHPASYRIHIDATGSRALHACLPPAQWAMFTELAALPPRGIAFVTERLERLAFIAEPNPTDHAVARAHPISRAGLRRLLLTGLEDAVVFDKRVVGYEHLSDGRVRATFADGTSATGDVLVGADGSASAVRKQLLPSARVVDTGVTGISGKVYLTDQVRERVPAALLDQMTMVLPAEGLAMFMAPFQGASDPEMPDHLFWALLGKADTLGPPPALRRDASPKLQQYAAHRVANWDPLLPRLVRESDSRSLISIPLHTARPVAAWPSTRVTLLGDAIHTMPPLQGLGGNTALRDAAVLRHHLVQADRSHAELVASIHAYEASMLEYGFEAVRRSLQVSDGITSTSRLGRSLFRTVLRVADKLPPVHRALFQRPEPGLPDEPAAVVAAPDAGRMPSHPDHYTRSTNTSAG